MLAEQKPLLDSKPVRSLEDEIRADPNKFFPEHWPPAGLPDLWSLESSISENTEEWFGKTPCDLCKPGEHEGWDHLDGKFPAVEVGPDGNFCEDHVPERVAYWNARRGKREYSWK